MSLFESLLRPALFWLDAETAHALAIRALATGLLPSYVSPADKRLGCTIAGLEFPNPVGLAAGFDKNAEVPDAMLGQGFGFVEAGSLTPRAQPGNPRPRIFRLSDEQGVINRLGFNNDGHAAALERLAARKTRSGIVGVNIGANKDSPGMAAGYVAGIEAFHDVASYFATNISSPNTPGLRSLQEKEALGDLLKRILSKRSELGLASGAKRPVFLKIAPDLDDRQMDGIAAAVEGSGLDGLIVSNTTLSRSGISSSPLAGESGGLSGKPLFERSTIVLARMRQRLQTLPMIGVGGVDSAATARAKIEAGADLVQLYTGMIYKGPGIARAINRGLLAMMDREGLHSLAELRGSKTKEWASRKMTE